MTNATDPKASLAGCTVVVTRASGQHQPLCQMLVSRGATVEHFPVLCLAPPADEGPLRSAVQALDEFDAVVLTSPNGARAFLDALSRYGPGPEQLSSKTICTVGPATRIELENAGVAVTLVPDEHQAQALAEKIVQTIEVRGKRFLLPLAQGARQVLEQRLAASGAAVQRVTAYRTLAVTEPPGQFAARLTRGKFDVVTFASSSAVSFFLERLGPQLANQARGCYTVACIGPSTSQTARESGLQVAIEAAPHTARGLIEAIIRHYGAS